MAQLQTLLVATDFSPIADRALAVARDYALALKGRIVLCHVVQTTSSALGEGVFVPSDEVRRVVIEAATKELETRARRLREEGVACSTKIVEGAPDRELANAAEAAGADVVVLGTHGRTGVARLFLGSVAQKVVAHAQRPVLLVPPAGRAS